MGILPFNKSNAKAAIYAFKGDVYTGLDADTTAFFCHLLCSRTREQKKLSEDELDFAQNNLNFKIVYCIFVSSHFASKNSGLY